MSGMGNQMRMTNPEMPEDKQQTFHKNEILRDMMILALMFRFPDITQTAARAEVEELIADTEKTKTKEA